MRPPPSRRSGVRPALAGVLAGAGLAVATAVVSFGAGPKFFPDDPLWREPETQDAAKVEEWDIDLAVDLATNLFGRPGDPTPDVRAANLNTVDEVPDSSWFTNRIGHRPVSIDEVVRGPVETRGPDGRQGWLVTHAKESGMSPGFTIKDAAGETWFVQFDTAGFPERATGSVVVASKIFWALGYYQVEYHLLSLRPDQLRLDPEATFKPPSGSRRRMRQGDVDAVLARAHRNADGSYRAVAGRAIPGKPLGGFRYYGTRPDDPNDVVPHEHRRELRALKVFGAWTNLVDMKAGNTLDTLVEVDGRRVVRHYLQDVGSTFGSSAIGHRDWDEGYDYLYQGRSLLVRSVFFGLPLPPWATVKYRQAASIGRFEGAAFDPRAWRPRAPTGAFLRARDDDAFWAARRVVAFTDPMIEAIARTGGFSDPRAATALAEVLMRRRDAIARAYLPAINPVVDVGLGADGALSFRNAAVDARVAAAPTSYAIEWARFDNATGEATVLGSTAIVTGTHASAPPLPTGRGAFVRVRIAATGGPAVWARPVDVYFRRSGEGWGLVGLERLP